jgi:hypothetical protein
MIFVKGSREFFSSKTISVGRAVYRDGKENGDTSLCILFGTVNVRMEAFIINVNLLPPHY